MARRIGGYVRDQHLALVCLFLVVGGGTALAASLPRDSVGSKQIKDGQVKTADLADGAVSAGKIKGIDAIGADRQEFGDAVDADPTAGDPVVFGSFTLTPLCTANPVGTVKAVIKITSIKDQIAVHSNAENGATNTFVSGSTGATLIQVGPSPNANIRAGDFGALSDTDSVTGEVLAGINQGTCAFAISGLG
jgi:hypothetical protein